MPGLQMTAVNADGDGRAPPALSDQGGESRSVALAERVYPTRPPLYKVVLLNDDYTPMEFVVAVLMEVFNKSKQDAVRIMLLVHQSGAGVGGVYPRDIADSKALRVMELAQRAQHPLQCRLERA